MLSVFMITLLLSLFCGVSTLTIGFFTLSKNRKGVIITSLILFASFTLFMLMEATLNYAFINHYNIFIEKRALFHLFYVVCLYLKMFIINYFIFDFTRLKQRMYFNIASALFFLILFIKDFRVANYEFETNWIMFTHLLPYFISIVLFFFSDLKKLDEERRWILKRIIPLFLANFLFVLIKLLKIPFLPLPYFYVTYILIGILFILYFLKFYHNSKKLSFEELSPRESEILNLITEGKSNADISDELCISISTVKNHIYSIYKKLGIKNRYELIKRAT